MKVQASSPRIKIAVVSLLVLGWCVSASALQEGSLTFVVADGRATITGLDWGFNGHLMIPQELGGYPVTAIGNNALNYRSGVTGLTIPFGVTNIGNNACAGCNNLTEATIPGSVQNIGESAFSYCRNLDTLTIHEGPQQIGQLAFCQCGIIHLIIPGSVATIGEKAFYQSPALTTLTIRDGVRQIGDYAFCQCPKLEQVSLPGSIHTIGFKAFAWCDQLRDLVLNNGLEHIGDWAFYGCGNLGTLHVPASVDSIGDRAFAFCTGLENIYFGGDLPELGPLVLQEVHDVTVYHSANGDDWDDVFANLPVIQWNAEFVSMELDISNHSTNAFIIGLNLPDLWSLTFFAQGPPNLPVSIQMRTNLLSGDWQTVVALTNLTAQGDLAYEPEHDGFYRLAIP